MIMPVPLEHAMSGSGVGEAAAVKGPTPGSAHDTMIWRSPELAITVPFVSDGHRVNYGRVSQALSAAARAVKRTQGDGITALAAVTAG